MKGCEAMLAFAQCGDMVMLVSSEAVVKEDEELLSSECIVFNLKTSMLSPRLPIGVWAKQIGPWERIESGTYTDEQVSKWLGNEAQ